MAFSNILTALFYIFLISIPFGYRVILHQFTIGFDEYETIFLYVSDIFLFLFLVAFGWQYYSIKSKSKNQKSPSKADPPLAEKLHIKNVKIDNQEISEDEDLRSLMSPKFVSVCLKDVGLYQIGLLFFLFFAGLSVFWATIPLLALYNFIRLLFLVLMALAVSRILTTNYQLLTTAFGIVAGLAVLESIIAFLQFLFQESLGFTLGLGRGLWFIGESTVGLDVPNSAKIIVDGAPVLRAYGTFPHPNVLGAFLVIGLISLFYFWVKRPSEWKIWSGISTLKSDLFYGLAIFITLSGIILTFSRAAWLITALISLLVTIYYLLVARNYWIQTVRLIFLLSVVSCLLLAVFWPFIFSRSQVSISEPAISYRLSYNELGMNLIKSSPMGVGIGNQVIYSVKNYVYTDAGMPNVWQWQPIHNLYLLMASEIGILGLLSFLGFIAMLLIYNLQLSIYNQFSIMQFSNVWSLSKWKFQSEDDPPLVENENCKLSLENYISKIMLTALLIFGMFDHFLWTLQPGRLMLWVTIGLVMGINYKKNEMSRM